VISGVVHLCKQYQFESPVIKILVVKGAVPDPVAVSTRITLKRTSCIRDYRICYIFKFVT
jgi:hypothetical protein